MDKKPSFFAHDLARFAPLLSSQAVEFAREIQRRNEPEEAEDLDELWRDEGGES